MIGKRGYSQAWSTCQYCKRQFKSLGIANHRAACRRKHIEKLKAERAISPQVKR